MTYNLLPQCQDLSASLAAALRGHQAPAEGLQSQLLQSLTKHEPDGSRETRELFRAVATPEGLASSRLYSIYVYIYILYIYMHCI